MITRNKWLDILADLGADMKKRGTVYGWKSPVNETNTLKKSTCVGYVSLALQRAGYLPSGKYVHYSNGKLSGTGLSYIKKHTELFTIKHVKATPQKLGSNLQVGDICLYTVPHIMVYAGKNSGGSPIWYSLERGSGGMGKAVKLTLKAVFGYYTKRKIEYIIRPKFSDSVTTAVQTATSTVAKTIRYKTKMAMNVRAGSNAKAKILFRVPKGGVVTVVKNISGSTWKQIKYCDQVGYMNCASKYATKL